MNYEIVNVVYQNSFFKKLYFDKNEKLYKLYYKEFNGYWYKKNFVFNKKLVRTYYENSKGTIKNDVVLEPYNAVFTSYNQKLKSIIGFFNEI